MERWWSLDATDNESSWALLWCQRNPPLFCYLNWWSDFNKRIIIITKMSAAFNFAFISFNSQFWLWAIAATPAMRTESSTSSWWSHAVWYIQIKVTIRERQRTLKRINYRNINKQSLNDECSSFVWTFKIWNWSQRLPLRYWSGPIFFKISVCFWIRRAMIHEWFGHTTKIWWGSMSDQMFPGKTILFRGCTRTASVLWRTVRVMHRSWVVVSERTMCFALLQTSFIFR